jgi:plastocyanin
MNGRLLTRRQLALVPTVLAIAALLAALAAALLRPAPAAAQDVTVEIVDFAFSPGSLEIEAGTTVTWVNNGAANHTATGDGGTFDTGTIAPGGSASITFSQPGTYSYICTIHPSMTAVIVVIGGDTGDDTGDGADTGDDTDTGGTTMTDLPSTGVGSALTGTDGNGLVPALLLLAAALGLTGFLLRRPRAA